MGENEYYVADLVGLEVYDEEGKHIGVLGDVIRTGANDVYEMKRTDVDDSAETIMIPGIKECVKNIDVENKIMTIHVMDGLFD